MSPLLGKLPAKPIFIALLITSLLLALTFHPSSPIHPLAPLHFHIPSTLDTVTPPPPSHNTHIPPFLFPLSRIPPAPYPFDQKPEQEPHFDFDVSPPRQPDMVVPNVVHFVWPSRAGSEDTEANLGGGESEEMPYSAYLSIRSAMLILKPERIYFHYTTIPRGAWFDVLRPHLTLNQVPTPTRVYDHTLEMAAHRADVLRILALQKLGGIYLDLDMYIVKPFDEYMYAPITMGVEAYPGSGGVAKGLCNAVVIAAPDATFLETWLRSYLEFRHDLYEYNGVIKPWNMARYDPTSVQVVSHEAFFNPTWDDGEIRMVHETTEWDWDASGQCAYHAWTSVIPHFIRDLNPRDVKRGDTSFHQLVKRYMGDDDEAIWDRLHN